MKKNPIFLGFIIAFSMMVFSILIYRFYIDQDNEFLLDNPTEKTCKIILNGKEYILAPFQNVKIEKLKKINTLKCFIEDSLVQIDTIFNIESVTKGIINPLKQDYYIYNRYYGFSKNKDSLQRAFLSKKIRIDSVEYMGDIKIKNEILISDFYLNLNQDFPKLLKKQDSLIPISKVFRKNDFINFYNTLFKK